MKDKPGAGYLPSMTAQERDLTLTADPRRMKIIAEAIASYVYEHNLEDDTPLNDFRAQMDVLYQVAHGLDDDDWGYTDEDRPASL